MSHVPRLAWFAWAVVCIVWGTTYLAIRVALETVPPASMVAMRWIVAGMVVSGLVWLRGGRLPPRDAWPGMALLGLLMIVFGNGFVVYAEQYVPSGLAAIVIATSPFWMVGVEAWLPGAETLRRGTIAGLLVGFGGIVLLVWPDLRAGGVYASAFGSGLVALQLACGGWALGSAYSKRRRRTGTDMLGESALQMLFGGLMMALVAGASGEWRMVTFSPRSGLALGYLTVAGSVGAYVAYLYALTHLPISTVSLYAYVNPIIAVGLGALILGEPFTPRVVMAATIVLAGLAVVRASSRRDGEGDARAPRRIERRARARLRGELKPWSPKPGAASAGGSTPRLARSGGCDSEPFDGIPRWPSDRRGRAAGARFDPRLPRLAASDHAPAGNQAHEEQHDGDHQQQPDEVAHRVSAHEPEQPQHDQDDRDCFQHPNAPSAVHRVCDAAPVPGARGALQRGRVVQRECHGSALALGPDELGARGRCRSDA